MITLPENAVSSILDIVSNFFSSFGVIITLIIGFYLGFWIIEKLANFLYPQENDDTKN